MRFHFAFASTLILLVGSLSGCASNPATATVCAAANPSPSPKQIAIFFDGTWNDKTDKTNVYRFYEGVRQQQEVKGCASLITYYVPGVGSDFRRLTGGAFGYGFSRNVREAYTWLASQYDPGDKIYVFGFSRGAFTARTFAAMIQQVGILNRDAYPGSQKSDFRNDVEELFKIVKQGGQEESERCGERFWTWNDIWWKKTAQGALGAVDHTRGLKAPGITARHLALIEAVAVWDTVGALGKSQGVPEPKYMVTVEGLPSLRRAYQALALDESRPNFSPIFWSSAKQQQCSQPTAVQQAWRRADAKTVEEVWFPGAHGDVGGGYKSDPSLADLSLAWIADQFRADGLVSESFTSLQPTARVKIAQTGIRHVPKGSAVAAKLFAPGIKGARKVSENPHMHASVFDRLAAPKDEVETGTSQNGYRPDALFVNGEIRKDLIVVGESNRH